MKLWIAALLLLGTLGSALAANPKVEVRTSHGVIVLELNEKEAPISVDNFLKYVTTGYYDGTIFHRVIDGFMVQGGGFDAEMRQKPTLAPIQNEAKNGLRNVQGSIAMARTSNPHSASAQFFINLVDNRALDYPSRDGWGYAVFGRVISGFEVVQAIGKVATGSVGPYQNVPSKPVIVESMRLIESATGDQAK
ncbi:MAG: peptidyl-prolyl cis-trans isomerase [Rhodocyclaceae bacterium]|jgi:peptidyl-prolyl cis-trans isomerase A (cyclophilin A)|nr:peptidyl-prolyl cis-trans isomerase [Rhodocyclaceae bacterium]